MSPDIPPVFLDTSGIYEATDRNATRHRMAADGLQALLRSRVLLITTDLVVAELHGLTLGRIGPDAAHRVAAALLTSPTVSVLATGPSLLADALDLLLHRPARRLSLVDAASFLVMRERQLDTAFALDADFAAEGFTLRP